MCATRKVRFLNMEFQLDMDTDKAATDELIAGFFDQTFFSLWPDDLEKVRSFQGPDTTRISTLFPEEECSHRKMQVLHYLACYKFYKVHQWVVVRSNDSSVALARDLLGSSQVFKIQRATAEQSQKNWIRLQRKGVLAHYDGDYELIRHCDNVSPWYDGCCYVLLKRGCDDLSLNGDAHNFHVVQCLRHQHGLQLEDNPYQAAYDLHLNRLFRNQKLKMSI